MKHHLHLAALVAACLALPAPGVLAKPSNTASSNLAACSFSDLTGVTVTACAGFFEGNLLKGNTGDTVSPTIAAILSGLGLSNSSTAIYVEKIADLGGSANVNFTTPLSGDTIVAMHLGKTLPGTTGDSNGTAFYRFDAGANLDSFGIDPKFNSSSGAAVFATSPVPEPESYALLLVGLSALGFLAKRRRG